jgi:antitoxin YefM
MQKVEGSNPFSRSRNPASERDFVVPGSILLLSVVYTIVYPLPMAKTVPVRELRANLSSLLDEVSDRRDHVLVTRNGVPAAALVPIDEYEALEETAEILSDPDAIAALEEGLGEIERGETITLAELRKELAAARPTSD